MKEIRVYADTSVFGGVYDIEFDTPSHTFFDQVKMGVFLSISFMAIGNSRLFPHWR